MQKILSKINLYDDSMVRIEDGHKSYAFFCKTKPVRVDQELIESLKTVFNEVDPRNVRLCLHEDSNANFHDMIILERKSRYYMPHRHNDKGESFHIMEGRMGVFTFSDNGSIIDSCILSYDDIRVYKVKPNAFHAVLPITNYVIYHETKPGPFLGEMDSIYPDWAPKVNNQNEINTYINTLKKEIEI